MAANARGSTEPAVGPTVSRPQLLDAGSDRRFRDLIQAMLGISSRFVDLRERIGRRVGLTGPQYSMLMSIQHLSAQDAGVTVGRLAAHLHVSGTFVTAESKKLEARGALQRRANPRDRRSVLLQLTPSGRRTLLDVLPMVRDINDVLFRTMGRGAFETVRVEMIRIAHSCDEALLVAERHALAAGTGASPLVGRRGQAVADPARPGRGGAGSSLSKRPPIRT